MTLLLAAAEWGGEFDGVLDDINALFDFPAIWHLELFGIDLSINRTILIAWFMTLVCATIFVMAFRRPSVVPSKLQSIGELTIDFVRQIAVDIIGPKGLKFVPLLTTFFLFVFFMNIAKITPFLMLPPTSRIAFPLFLAGIAWFVYVGVGIKEQGLVHYFKELAFPPGVPKALYVILTPIELVSNLVLRPFTLAIRLFANMVAGHILVVITLVTAHVFLPSLPAGTALGVFAVIISPLVFGFELLIIGLQAYIFTMLTAVYISSSVEPAH
ncbi:MAG: F0F1 ATP synthase subunit A [Nitriliruptoraceae bacterium]